MRGKHTLKTWSTSQKAISLRSGEAELIALVKASAEMIGLLQMLNDWNMMCEGSMYVDSSAALGVVGRKGCGKLRHVRVGNLWIQEKRESGELQFKKVKGSVNPADMMTKLVAPLLRARHMSSLGLDVKDGRASESLAV